MGTLTAWFCARESAWIEYYQKLFGVSSASDEISENYTGMPRIRIGFGY